MGWTSPGGAAGVGVNLHARRARGAPSQPRCHRNGPGRWQRPRLALSKAVSLRPSLAPSRIARRGLKLAGKCSAACTINARVLVSTATARRRWRGSAGAASRSARHSRRRSGPDEDDQRPPVALGPREGLTRTRRRCDARGSAAVHGAGTATRRPSPHHARLGPVRSTTGGTARALPSHSTPAISSGGSCTSTSTPSIATRSASHCRSTSEVRSSQLWSDTIGSSAPATYGRRFASSYPQAHAQ